MGTERYLARRLAFSSHLFRLQKQKKVVQQLEQEIETIERRQIAIAEELELPETWSDGRRSADLNRELAGNVERLDRLATQWETEASRLEIG